MNDARVRLRYLDQTISLLFPGPGEARPYSLLPHSLFPRRLAPRAWWHPGRKVMVPSGETTVETYLSEVLSAPVRVVLRIRPARRANRKPILEAHTPDGLAAFVKIGDTDRARELVANEARTLDLLAGVPLKTVVVPTVLHHGFWRGLSVLALAPLPVRRGSVPEGLLIDAIKEIARIPASQATDSQTTGSQSTVPQTTAHQITGSQTTAPQTTERRFAWHGDLAPWNVARGVDGRLLVWDWERFGTGVPLGFDAVHHFFHRALRRTDPATAARTCLAQALPTLAPFGLSAAQSRLTAIHYLIALADRHAADGHDPLGPPALWLNPVVDYEELLA